MAREIVELILFIFVLPVNQPNSTQGLMKRWNCDTRIGGVAHTATREKGKKRKRAILGASVCITFYYSYKKLVNSLHLEHNDYYYYFFG